MMDNSPLFLGSASHVSEHRWIRTSFWSTRSSDENFVMTSNS